MIPGPKPPPPIDLNSIVIGGGIGILTLLIPILSVLGESHVTPDSNKTSLNKVVTIHYNSL